MHVWMEADRGKLVFCMEEEEGGKQDGGGGGESGRNEKYGKLWKGRESWSESADQE